MDFEERAWEAIHYAAYEGSFRQLERILTEFPESLEHVTGAKSQNVGLTPLLCAAMGNKTEIIIQLLELKANMLAVDAKSQNACEIAICQRHVETFMYLFKEHNESLSPVKTLMEQLGSTDEIVVYNAINFLDVLLQNEEALNLLWTEVIENNFVKLFKKIAESDMGSAQKQQCLNWVFSLCKLEEFREMSLEKFGMIEFIMSLAKTFKSIHGPSGDTSFSMDTLSSIFNQLFEILEKLVLKTSNGIQKLRMKGGIPVLLENLLDSNLNEGTKLIIISLLISVANAENFVEKPKEPEIEQVTQSELETDDTLEHEVSSIKDDFEEFDETEISDEGGITYEDELLNKQREIQDEFRSFNNLVELVKIYSNNPSETMIKELNKLIRSISEKNEDSQNLFVLKGSITESLLHQIKKQREKDIQLSCIDTLKVLVLNNEKSQQAAIAQNAIDPINSVLKRSRQNRVQLSCSSALWALAGSDIYRKRHVCDLIGIRLFLDYLSTDEDELLLLASEGLALSCEGPFGKAEEIGQQGGIIPLTRLFRHSDEHIVMGGIRAMRKMVVGIGLLPVKSNQKHILDSRSHKFLLALMKHGKRQEVQIEAALTLSHISIGIQNFHTYFEEDNAFSYAPLLYLLSTPDMHQRAKVGTALACFGYNNIQEQVQISRYRALKYKYFKHMLLSKEEPMVQCNAAYQVVILSKIIEDEDPAVCAAEGIKALISLLESSQELEVQVFVCECICRLARTTDAGIPEAMIAIDVVKHLANLVMKSTDVHVRGTASIALGYLSMRFSGWRKLLELCRKNGEVVGIVQPFCKPPYKISTKFLQQWKHYQEVAPTTECGNEKQSSPDEIRKSIVT